MWIVKKKKKKKKDKKFNSTILCISNVCWFPSGGFQWKNSPFIYLKLLTECS